MKLRPFTKEDAAVVCTWLRTERDLFRWSADRFNKFPLTADDVFENYGPQIEGGRFFALSAVDDEDHLLGHFILRYPKEDDDTSVRFGFVILDPALRGKGNGKEMLRLGIQYAKEVLNVSRIDLGVFANNDSARYCYEAAGFKEYDRSSFEIPIGTWDCIEMELFLR